MNLTRQEALLVWYRAHHRKLPWRADPDGPLAPGYAVVVSELMLQQTRVDTVRDYFARWLHRWPGWADLAQATEEEVLQQWTGLGYYRRARYLHAAAKAVCERHGGKLPSDPEALQALPGLGPYTVGAVRSIVFGQPAALVDGNVTRVLSRWLALADDPSQGAGKKAVWSQAERELEPGLAAHAEPGNWNQALMELGATLCNPKDPQCMLCPVQGQCEAHAQGLQRQIPPVRQRTAVLGVQARAVVVLRPRQDGLGEPTDDLVLLGRRGPTGRWAGLWEPPTVEGDEASETLHKWLGDREIQHLAELPEVVHLLSHRRYVVGAAVVAERRPGPELDVHKLGYVGSRWMTLAAALGQTSGLSRLGQRLLEQWLAEK